MSRAPRRLGRWTVAATAAIAVVTAGAAGYSEVPTPTQLLLLGTAALTAGATALAERQPPSKKDLAICHLATSSWQQLRAVTHESGRMRAVENLCSYLSRKVLTPSARCSRGCRVTGRTRARTGAWGQGRRGGQSMGGWVKVGSFLSDPRRR